MVTGLVTVVLPIYNVEKYLDRCISSVVEQTYKNLEIILVDDGSPDRCPDICEEWAARDARIKVIHKINAGLGMARNTGIEHASGEYICFFDSDDYIEPNTIEVCVQVAKEENADLVSFGNDRVTQEGNILSRRVPNPPKQVFFGTEIIQTLLPKALGYDPNTGDDWNLSLSAWSSLYSMKAIARKQWRFVSEREIISEDYFSLAALYGSLEKVAIVDSVFYHYVVNPTSLTQTYKADKYQRIKVFYQELLKLGEDMGALPYIHMEAAEVFLGFTIGCFKQIVASGDMLSLKLERLRDIVEDACMQDVLKENHFPGDPIGKKVLWYAIRKKNVLLCFLTVKIRSLKEKIAQ